MRKLSNQVSASFAERVEKLGCTVPQWVVLRVLYDHESLRLKDIVTQVEMDQGGISRMVDGLLEQGLVTRVSDAKDRRAVAVSLTDKGRDLVPKLAQAADENERTFFSSLTPGQLEQLQTTIKKLLADNQIDDKHVTE
jgi:DNA-binding MarR family transcriptional regulator